jgi:dTDP-4-dehydrorhamnose 3,5-epimerase
MPFFETGFPGLTIFEPAVFGDNRGYFFESYNENVFSQHGINTGFVQDNQSSSEYGVIRGLHFQLPPFAQSKLVRVLHGRIMDVGVDLRKGSPTYGKVFQVELSAENKKQLYLPRGFAHGFSVLSEKAEVLYKCDAFYNKQSEEGILFNDPDLNIDWQIPADKIKVSDKDQSNRLFKEAKKEFVFGDHANANK